MSTRITSKMMMNAYKSTLSTSMQRVNRDSQAVTNERKYLTDSEDPVSATRAYQYRRETTRNSNYQTNTQQVSSLLTSRESVVMDISSMAREVLKEDTLGAVNGTSSKESRQAYAQQIEELQRSAIQSLNTSYGSTFMFGGTSSNQVPFELDDGDGTVLYRGVPVDGLSRTDMKEYNSLKASGADPDRLAELQATLDENMAKLDSYNAETQYVDLGFGLEFDEEGNVNPNSAFNIVSNGISFLGYGTDSEGNSTNLIQLMGDLADAITADSFDDDYVQELSDNFESAMTDLTMELTQLGSDENFMDTNLERLEEIELNLTEKTNATEYISSAEAITDFQMSQYAYRAALQIGSQILSQSFLDYMK
jgi:flagellar hook-associated protein 3 FlgL